MLPAPSPSISSIPIMAAHLASTEEVRDRNKNEVEDKRLRYGWGSFRPVWLQGFNKPRWVLCFLCVASFQQSLTANGLLATSISPIERRFGLTSVRTALITSVYEIAGIPCILFISYLGALGRRMRWVALGVFLQGVGSLFFVIPHFATGVYQISDKSESNLCRSNSSLPDTCSATDSDNADLSNYLYVFLLAQALNGMGAAPLYTIGLTYLDDCCSKGKAALYTGRLATRN